jgi:hypothetical protein
MDIYDDCDVSTSKTLREQLAFYFHGPPLPAPIPQGNGSQSNLLSSADRAFHDWYRFVLSYPPHLVRNYLQEFDFGPDHTVLDPFCGTGTTVVEARLNHVHSVGVEANPFAHFAGSVKVDWAVDPDQLMNCALDIAEATAMTLQGQSISDDPSPAQTTGYPVTSLRTLEPARAKLLIKDSISPLPLHKTLVLLEHVNVYAAACGYNHLRLALANALVNKISNLRFGPEVGVGKQKEDAPVIAAWLHEVGKIVQDLRWAAGRTAPPAIVHLADARDLNHLLQPCSVDGIITSPPYPNEKDYTRTTRLESVLLGFIADMPQLRALKKTLVRSNTRSVYVEDQDDQWVAHHTEIQRIAHEIEARRLALGKTSGFEKLYGRVTKLYFGGMARHFAALRQVLRPGARLAYVVGDQASYLQVMIRTGQLLADVAERSGYRVERIDLFRTRFATATQSELREEVVVLTWPGDQS